MPIELRDAAWMLKQGLLSPDQFLEACAEWADRPDTDLRAFFAGHGRANGQEATVVDPAPPGSLATTSTSAASPTEAASQPGPVPSQAPTHAYGAPDGEWPHVGGHPTELWAPGAPAEDVSAAPPAAARYEALRRITLRPGREVLVAWDSRLGRNVVLKALLEKDRQFSSRFLRESRITARLEHPGIVPIHDMEEGPAPPLGCPFYTMRFIEGLTLREASQAYHAAGTNDPATLRAMLTAFVAVCETAAYAHSKGVVHRDLKGENIVLGEFGEVVLLDWGIAKRVGVDADDPSAESPSDDDLRSPHAPTADGQVLGTPGFMSPEQAAGLSHLVDPRTDVYGLGAVLYEILTARPPFVCLTFAEFLRAVRDDPPTPPSKLVPETPRPLEAVCLKALAKDQAARYASASDLAAEVRRWLAGEPVHAWPESLPLRLNRFARRHKRLIAAAGLVLLTATPVLAWDAWRVGQERDQKERQRLLAEDNSRVAREVVVELLARFADEELPDIPRLAGFRRELAREALNRFEYFLMRNRNDTRLNREAAQVYRTAANLEQLAGQFQEAHYNFRHARKLLEALPPGERDALDVESLWAGVAVDEALLMQKLGQSAEARPLLEEGIRRASVDRLDPLRRVAAHGLLALGTLDAQAGRYEEAGRSFTTVYDQHRHVADNPRAKDIDVVLWVTAATSSARVRRERGDLAGALDRLDNAEPRLRQALAAAPSRGLLRIALAGLLTERILAYAARPGGGADARQVADEAVGLAQEFARDFPRYPFYQEVLADAYSARAAAAGGDAGGDAGGADLGRSRDILQALDRDYMHIPRFRAKLGVALAGLAREATRRGRPEDARPLAARADERLRDALKADPELAFARRALADLSGR